MTGREGEIETQKLRETKRTIKGEKKRAREGKRKREKRRERNRNTEN